MSRRLPVSVSSLLLGALIGWSPSGSRAQARDPAPSCGQAGRAFFDKDSTLSDAAGRKIARFSGGESAVTLLAPPRTGSELLHIETGTGHGSFRLKGLIKASDVRTYAKYSVPVLRGHIWLGAGTRVTLTGSTGDKVRVEKLLSTPFSQRFSAVTECSALTFTAPAAGGASMPGSARVYLLKSAALDLYDDAPPTGSPITRLERSPLVDNVRFFSTERRGGFVRVQYRGEIEVDAWAKASDLTALPRGETSDLPPTSYTTSSPPQLQLAQPPRVVKSTRELPVRLAARDAEAPVGVIEPDTEIYLLDTVAGWANVLPKSLSVLPVGEQAFWVKAADLGL